MAVGERRAVALRALFEGAPVDLELLALAAGLRHSTLQKMARRESWVWGEMGAKGAVTLQSRLRQLSVSVVGQLEEASLASLTDGHYDKARLEALGLMLRSIEKLGELTQTPEHAADEQMKSDAEMAAAIGKINQRIIELARELAAAGALVPGADAAPDRAGPA